MKKKRSFGQSILNFLGDSSPFMTLVGKAAFLVVLNVCWLVCCVPVVTAGASTAALYAVLLERGEHSYLSAPPAFFRRFRSRRRHSPGQRAGICLHHLIPLGLAVGLHHFGREALLPNRHFFLFHAVLIPWPERR